MSRWHDEFENHPFQPIWANILKVTNSLTVDNTSVITHVQEAARLKKVVEYLDSLLQASDKELVPLLIWTDFQKQSQLCLNQMSAYYSSRNINNIANANAHLDNLLSYLKPYVVDGRTAARASTMAQKAYNDTVADHMASYVSEANTAISRIQDTLERVDQFASEIEPVINKAKQFDDWAFKGISGHKSLEGRIEDWALEVERNADQVESNHQSILETKSGKNKKQTWQK